MEQPELFHESIFESLKATVSACGGPKVVASKLIPEKPADEAARYLNDCLNPDRPANLPLEQLTHLLKIARGKGIHLAATWIMADCGYAQPVPVEPEDQQAELIRQFNRSAAEVVAMGERIARLNITAIEPRQARR